VVVSDDWSGPGRFTLSGVGLVTGYGGPSFPDSPITVAIIGGNAVTFSNIRLTLGGDAATNHFGTVALGGVVSATR
jgi:hypothetical protein